jgi:inhibitor of KinA sporulation pathway (predicted exonuclease)
MLMAPTKHVNLISTFQRHLHSKGRAKIKNFCKNFAKTEQFATQKAQILQSVNMTRASGFWSSFLLHQSLM